MKIDLKILSFLWLTFWLYAGILMFLDTPGQIARDKKFIETQIKPSVDFIKHFKTTNNRLPTNREFYTWERDYYKDYTSDLKLEVDSLIQGSINYIRHGSDIVTGEYGVSEIEKLNGADWKKDFAIGVWRGEWNEYYFSWTDSYDSNDCSWTNGYISLGVTTGLGLLPLLFWWGSIKQSKKSST